MTRKWIIVIVAAIHLLCWANHAVFAVDESAASFLSKIKAVAEEAEKAEKPAIKGKDGWLFFTPELRNLSVGQFWGEQAAKVSRASSADAKDPLPAILDFKAQLDRAGIELIFVPVPAKAAIYPDKVDVQQADLPTRSDVYHKEFYNLLATKGVKVLDLTPEFVKQRGDDNNPLYCKQDTHWSGRACSVTAKLIANELKDKPWMKGVQKRKFDTENIDVQLTGDLWTYLGDTDLPKETLKLTMVKEAGQGTASSVEPWRESPVLLVGDSHNLIFHAGEDMHAKGAGLADHLALEIGFPVDLVAVRGSGATPSRINLLRRKDNLEGKKMVIWCLSVREFTEGQGWKKVPIIK